MSAVADTLIRNANIYNGSGSLPVIADLAMRDGRIAALGPSLRYSADCTIDGNGLALAPGFIDTHTHDDCALLTTDMSAKVSQGVTTVVTGNCGISAAPLVLTSEPPPPLNLLGGEDSFRYETFADYLEELRACPAALNVCTLVGHSTLRVGVMDRLDRGATAAELDEMKKRLGDALATGAFGFSSGLEYPPAIAATGEEVIELASVCASRGGIYTAHIRDEGDHVEAALEESFDIAAKAHVPLLISHHKCCGSRNHGRSRSTLAQIARAQNRQTVSLDVYPYDASSTVLRKQWVTDSRRTMVTWSRSHPEMNARDLSDIARDWNVTIDAAIDELQPAGAVYFDMDEDDVQRIMRFPSTMIGSDGLPNDAHPHPRLWGTFPRVLGRYVRELKLFPMEEAVRRMTSLPAATFGIAARGCIAPGFYADLVLFDPREIRDAATFEQPKVASPGIHMVWVNGRCVWEEGKRSSHKPGEVLKSAAA